MPSRGTIVATSPLKAPMPYWGGKSKAAPVVWQRFGPVKAYIEPFFGSGAVLLQSPYGPATTEVVHDINSLICNLFRSLQRDPDLVAYWADFPCNHTEFAARRKEIQRRYEGLTERLLDWGYYDAELAGLYCWYLSNDIGIGMKLLSSAHRKNGRPLGDAPRVGQQRGHG